MTKFESPAKGQDVPQFFLENETSDDANWIDQLHRDAFGPGRFTRAAFFVRAQARVELDLCFVAKIDGLPAGTVRLSHIQVGDAAGYLLGPLAIAPQYRNLGIGGTLLDKVNAVAATMHAGEFILLVGDAPYYGPHGYEKVGHDTIAFPAPVDPDRIMLHGLNGVRAGQISGFVKGIS